jgi:hypothetical protein
LTELSKSRRKGPDSGPFGGLWDSRDRFTGKRLPAELPEPARRYLEHAIAAGTVLASSVKLQMRGEIKLNRWRSFTGDQIIHRNLEFAWNANTSFAGIPTRGIARLIGGKGAVLWKVFHIVPVASQGGRHITRSAVGRAMLESIFLPPALLERGVHWTALTEARPHAHIVAQGESAELAFRIAVNGAVENVQVLRWAHTGGGDFHYRPFGAIVEEEQRFNGYTIPTRLRVGYYAGSDRFETDGEFLRITIENATFL